VLLAAPAARSEQDRPLPVDELVDAAISRRGLVPEPTTYARARLTRGVVPQLRLSFTADAPNDLAYRVSHGSTVRDTDGSYAFVAEVVFKPDRSPANSTDVLAAEGSDTVLFLDDETVQAGAARVRRDALAYVDELVESVTQLVYAHEAMVRRRPDARGRPLLDQLDLELQIREIEARLDVYTDGKVTRLERESTKESP
jgi:hypothetical protein